MTTLINTPAKFTSATDIVRSPIPENITASATVDITSQDIMRIDTISNAVDLVLPSATTATGVHLLFKFVAGSLEAKITPFTAETIDGLSEFIFGEINDYLWIVSNGTTWDIYSDASDLLTSNIYNEDGTITETRTVTLGASGLLVFAADYSSTFTDRSLVDKEYVDLRIRNLTSAAAILTEDDLVYGTGTFIVTIPEASTAFKYIDFKSLSGIMTVTPFAGETIEGSATHAVNALESITLAPVSGVGWVII